MIWRTVTPRGRSVSHTTRTSRTLSNVRRQISYRTHEVRDNYIAKKLHPPNLSPILETIKKSIYIDAQDILGSTWQKLLCRFEGIFRVFEDKYIMNITLTFTEMHTNTHLNYEMLSLWVQKGIKVVICRRERVIFKFVFSH